jgi:hypothetical protein
MLGVEIFFKLNSHIIGENVQKYSLAQGLMLARQALHQPLFVIIFSR